MMIKYARTLSQEFSYKNFTRLMSFISQNKKLYFMLNANFLPYNGNLGNFVPVNVYHIIKVLSKLS